MTTITVPVSWDSLYQRILNEVHPQVISSEAFQRNKFGEFNYGSFNNEKSLNTTLYPNGAPTLSHENSMWNLFFPLVY